jgi:molybdopterin synthase sulfur carrier subunit
MPTIHIPNPLRSYVNGLADVTVSGDTVEAAMNDMLVQFPVFRSQLCKDDGSYRAFVNLFLNEINIRDLQGLHTAINASDVINLVPSIAGG